MTAERAIQTQINHAGDPPFSNQTDNSSPAKSAKEAGSNNSRSAVRLNPGLISGISASVSSFPITIPALQIRTNRTITHTVTTAS